MPPRAPSTLDSPLPVPDVASDASVAVIPTASAAPLDGRPDGERLTTFTLADKPDEWMLEDSAVTALGEMRDRVLSKPLTYVAAAFSLGFVLSRLLR